MSRKKIRKDVKNAPDPNVSLVGGDDRAEYGKQVVEKLSVWLTARYGRGFSTTNLWYFRQFFHEYSSRIAILHPPGGELSLDTIG